MACEQLLRSTPRVQMACLEADSELTDALDMRALVGHRQPRDFSIDGDRGVVRKVEVFAVESADGAREVAQRALRKREKKGSDILFIFFVGSRLHPCLEPLAVSTLDSLCNLYT